MKLMVAYPTRMLKHQDSVPLPVGKEGGWAIPSLNSQRRTASCPVEYKRECLVLTLRLEVRGRNESSLVSRTELYHQMLRTNTCRWVLTQPVLMKFTAGQRSFVQDGDNF